MEKLVAEENGEAYTHVHTHTHARTHTCTHTHIELWGCCWVWEQAVFLVQTHRTSGGHVEMWNCTVILTLTYLGMISSGSVAILVSFNMWYCSLCIYLFTQRLLFGIKDKRFKACPDVKNYCKFKHHTLAPAQHLCAGGLWENVFGLCSWKGHLQPFFLLYSHVSTPENVTSSTNRWLLSLFPRSSNAQTPSQSEWHSTINCVFP